MNFKFLKKIVETPGVPSHKNLIRSLIIKNIKDTSDEYYIDSIGNLIVRKKADLVQISDFVSGKPLDNGINLLKLFIETAHNYNPEI